MQIVRLKESKSFGDETGKPLVGEEYLFFRMIDGRPLDAGEIQERIEKEVGKVISHDPTAISGVTTNFSEILIVLKEKPNEDLVSKIENTLWQQ